ncbi:TetR/AcrR family transcriptional regulator [Ottowia sp. VDI28]|uniref:TetR/AcrR family transcriptional regulator n=1 Tax=Ottowia sp. VDI28 TaxID=3133968 RepID=UPI003C2D176C
MSRSNAKQLQKDVVEIAAAKEGDQAPPRRRGRPPKPVLGDGEAAPVLTREQILAKAIELARVQPLSEISMVGLARELGVAPALIHYYVGSRDDLISGVANLYFKALMAGMPPLTGDWEEDLWEGAQQAFRIGVEYGGVLRYMMSNNRFRLFQQVPQGETDYGVLYLDRMAKIFRSGGFQPEQAATGYHLLSLYVISSSYSEVSRQLPRFHQRFIRDQVEGHPFNEVEHARFFIGAFSALDSATAFPAGLKILIAGFRSWLPGH